jgi:tetratricopeptide (TPR) repeat protein
MFKTGFKPVYLIGIGLLLLVLFLFVPRKPWSMAAEKEEITADADSLKLLEAIELVNSPNPMQGIMILRELVNKDSNNADAHYWLGTFAVQSGQLDRAIQRFNHVIKLNPSYLAAYIDLGGVYQRLNQPEVSLQYYEKALAIDSTNNLALLFTAKTYEGLGKKREALHYYQGLLRHNQDSVVRVKIEEVIEKLN